MLVDTPTRVQSAWRNVDHYPHNIVQCTQNGLNLMPQAFPNSFSKYLHHFTSANPCTCNNPPLQGKGVVRVVALPPHDVSNMCAWLCWMCPSKHKAFEKCWNEAQVSSTIVQCMYTMLEFLHKAFKFYEAKLGCDAHTWCIACKKEGIAICLAVAVLSWLQTITDEDAMMGLGLVTLNSES